MLTAQDASNTDLGAMITKIAAGDRTAFADLYRALERPVFRFIRSKLNDPFRSSDILHDVFLDVWRAAGSFEGRSSVKTWVFGIAYRKVIDEFRKNGRMDLMAETPEQEDDGPSPEQCLLAAQTATHVRDCLDTLKPDHRSVIELAFFEDLGYREIAEAVNAPEGTVKTRVFHAKKLLMRCLEGRIGKGEMA